MLVIFNMQNHKFLAAEGKDNSAYASWTTIPEQIKNYPTPETAYKATLSWSPHYVDFHFVFVEAPDEWFSTPEAFFAEDFRAYGLMANSFWPVVMADAKLNDFRIYGQPRLAHGQRY
jgi:hypothetical protein